MLHYISFFFFNDTATTEIYTLSLHDALPIFRQSACQRSLEMPYSDEADERSASRRSEMLEKLLVPVAVVGHVLFYDVLRSEEHTSELQSQSNLVCRLLLEKKKIYNLCINRSH